MDKCLSGWAVIKMKTSSHRKKKWNNKNPTTAEQLPWMGRLGECEGEKDDGAFYNTEDKNS